MFGMGNPVDFPSKESASVRLFCWFVSALYLKKNNLTLKSVLHGKRCFASIITVFRYRFLLLWFLYRDIYFTLGTVSGTYRFSRWHFGLWCRKAAPGTLERQQAVHAKNLMEWNEVYRLYWFKWNLSQSRSDWQTPYQWTSHETFKQFKLKTVQSSFI